VHSMRRYLWLLLGKPGFPGFDCYKGIHIASNAYRAHYQGVSSVVKLGMKTVKRGLIGVELGVYEVSCYNADL
jgi:hypothetical protein